MLFGRLFLCALLIGAGVGLVHSAVQRWQVIPIIEAAEAFESASTSAAGSHGHDDAAAASHSHDHAAAASHSHDSAAWEPAPGAERSAWTVIANMLVAIGFALLLLPAIAWWDHWRGGQAASLCSGLLWGAAAWLCVVAWPALGLQPELPGEATAPLHARQAWWLLTVVSAVGGFGMLAFARGKWRLLGLTLLALPFIVGAPHPAAAPFAGFGAEAAAAMTALKTRFLLATTLANAVQWLLLGAACAVAVARWVRPLLASPAAADGMATSVKQA